MHTRMYFFLPKKPSLQHPVFFLKKYPILQFNVQFGDFFFNGWVKAFITLSHCEGIIH